MVNALMRPLVVELLAKGIEARLLLQDIGGSGLGRVFLQGETHALVSSVLLGMAGLDALDVNAKPQPPDRELAQAIERRGGREGHAVIGANRRREPKFSEGVLEDREGELFLRRRQGLTREQVAGREIRDGQRIAVPAIAEHELAFVVGAPKGVGVGRARELGAGGGVWPAAAVFHKPVAIEHGMHGAIGGEVGRGRLPPQLFANLRCAPAWVLSLQPDDRRFKLRRQSIRRAIGSPTPIRERRLATVLVTVVNLVARFAGDPKLGAERRHLLALEQPGNKPNTLVHGLTLLPRHAPSLGAKVSPMCPEYGVTYVSGRTLDILRGFASIGGCVAAPCPFAAPDIIKQTSRDDVL
jgi:hypothetical protein